MSQNVLTDNDAHVHDGSDGDGDARQRYDVGVDAKGLHRDKGEQDRQGKHATDQHTAAKVQHHHDHHDEGDQDFLSQCVVQGTQRLVDQTGSIIERNHRDLAGVGPRRPLLLGHCPEVFDPRIMIQFCSGVGLEPSRSGISSNVIRRDKGSVNDHLRRQAGRYLFFDLLLCVLDDSQRVIAVSGNDHTADGFCAILVQRSTAQGWAQCHRRHVLDPDRDVFVHLDDALFDILHLLDEADAANEVLHAVQFDGLGAHVDVGALYRHVDFRQRHAVGPHGVRIDVDLVLPHEAAHRRHFADAISG